MTDDKNDILIKIGELRGTINGHDKRLDQQHADLLDMRKDITDIKAAQADFKNYVTACFADQNRLLVAEIAKVATETRNGAISVREFIQNRPITATIGSSSIASSLLIWVLTTVGILQPGG